MLCDGADFQILDPKPLSLTINWAISPKKTPAFKPSYVEKYSLRISVRHPQTQKVVSVDCRFCAAFGRECKIGAKRKATSNVHFFTSFRADQIKAHLEN
ncbi:hypothetical protein PsorP6_007099 [Peronosclerospora sorghi]|uniref:Uncharacterized protein n=1 Tax=Peronosclerospora sorghi TaxID=230839 RepID=A0ACC0WAH2_9STRA|nr:hypothetical protein PsorP6_007099 [Peronosclerospora sorghi]